MKCVTCGGATRVTDSRDDRHPRNDWLVRYGTHVFGWYSSDFRLRKRTCQNPECGKRETTIEVTLDDLEESFDNLRQRGQDKLREIPLLSSELLESNRHLSQRQLDTLVRELLVRREAERSLRRDY